MVIVAKKKPFEVEIPLVKQSVQALAPNQDALIGRIIKLDLTRVLKGKNLEANIIIKKENDILVGEFTFARLMPSYISKTIRKGISYIEDSFLCSGKESKFLVKPFLLTRKKINRSLRKALRNKAREIIFEFVKEKSNKEIFFSVLYGGMQKELSYKLKKIYPLTFSEIRVIKIK
jgi:ribosomal protein S3AE